MKRASMLLAALFVAGALFLSVGSGPGPLPNGPGVNIGAMPSISNGQKIVLSDQPLYAAITYSATYPLDYDDIASYDWVHFGTMPMYPSATGFEGMMDSVLVRNPDFFATVYCHMNLRGWEWADRDPDTVPRWGLFWDMLARADSVALGGAPGNGFARDISGNPVIGLGFGTRIMGVMDTTAIDSAAIIYADMMTTCWIKHPRTGFYLDWWDGSGYPSWNADLSQLDFNQNGIPYSSEPEVEKALYVAAADRFITTLRRVAREKLGYDPIIINNGNMIEEQPAIAAKLDGEMKEKFDKYWPGGSATEEEWAKLLALRPWEAYRSDKLNPPGYMLAGNSHVVADSNSMYIAEIIAPALKGYARDSGDGDGYLGNVQNIGRRLPDPGTFVDYEYIEAGARDTLVMVYENWTGKILLGAVQTVPGAGSPSPRPWPYIVITAEGDTISRGGIPEWPRADDLPAVESFSVDALNEGMADEVVVSVSAGFNMAVDPLLTGWDVGAAEPDTSLFDFVGIYSDTLHADITLPAVWATADADSTVVITWSAGSPAPTSGYRLDVQINNGSFAALVDTLTLGPSAGEYIHTASSPISVRRGKLVYRITAISGSRESSPLVSDPLYNDSMEMNFRLWCFDGSDWAFSPIETGIGISYPVELGGRKHYIPAIP